MSTNSNANPTAAAAAAVANNNTTARLTAVRLNQEGAMAFQEGNFALAMRGFRSALQMIVAHQPPPGNNDPTLDHSHEDRKQLSSPDMHAYAAMGIQQLPMPTSSRCCSSRDDDAFVYIRPLIFNTAYLPDSQDGVAVFCAVAVFNMAVVFHRRSLLEDHGKEERSSRATASHVQNHRTKALSLYESAADLFSKVSNRFDLSGAMSAALNNRACLFHANRDFEESIQELQQLQRLMQRAEHSMSTPAILETNDFQGILLNLLLLKPPALAEAA